MLSRAVKGSMPWPARRWASLNGGDCCAIGSLSFERSASSPGILSNPVGVLEVTPPHLDHEIYWQKKKSTAKSREKQQGAPSQRRRRGVYYLGSSSFIILLHCSGV